MIKIFSLLLVFLLTFIFTTCNDKRAWLDSNTNTSLNHESQFEKQIKEYKKEENKRREEEKRRIAREQKQKEKDEKELLKLLETN